MLLMYSLLLRLLNIIIFITTIVSITVLLFSLLLLLVLLLSSVFDYDHLFSSFLFVINNYLWLQTWYDHKIVSGIFKNNGLVLQESWVLLLHRFINLIVVIL
jgi:hypothetical protein